MSKYLEVLITVDSPFSEILLAELANYQFDSFEENETGIKAYIEHELFEEQSLANIAEQYEGIFSFTYEIGELEEKNWNEEWEKNFTSTAVDNDVIIRSEFHPVDESYPYELVITPQMSFGTGHHDTTAGVIRAMLKLDFQNKTVLDAGTGTGILSIMAKKLGAAYTYAYDIDQWSYNNCLDNFRLNDISDIEIEQGDVTLLDKLGKDFDMVLANINKNVLLADIPHFAKHLKENGYLVLSGFYEKDIEDLQLVTNTFGLKLESKSVSENDWTVLVFKK